MNRRQYIETAFAAISTGVLAGCSAGGSDTASISFDSQTTNGATVTVKSVSLPNGGYAAVHDVVRLENSPVGTVLGVSGYLKPGTHKNIPVGLFEVPGGKFSLERLSKSQTLSAVAHRETNDNRTFDYLVTNGREDEPYHVNDSIVVDTAYITVKPRTNATATQATTTANTTSE